MIWVWNQSPIFSAPPGVELKLSVHHRVQFYVALWKFYVENRGIDPRTSRMLSERSTIWASSPDDLSSIEFGSTIPKNRLCKNVKNRQFLPAEIHKTPSFSRQGNQKAPFIAISQVVKTLSEVGFEPTPTFVDQNTPVRKSSTLESGALDRSAILTCQLVKNNEALNRMHVDLGGNPKFDSLFPVDAPRWYISLYDQGN